MLKLNDVTLVVVTSVKHDENVKALKHSIKDIEFESVKFISDIKPESLPDNVEYIKCDKLDYVGFSRFTFLELWKYVDTKFSLLVHHDGFIIRPDLWDDDFLNFDYIGAPWEYSETAYVTDYGEHVEQGNGGVCLRSKKILEMPSKLGLSLQERQGYYNDDGNFCVYQRKTFLDNGIKYAPKELAAKFSTEIWIPGVSTESFAFHGFGHNDHIKYKGLL